MSYLEIFLLALALSIDASVVSFTYGLTFEREKFKTALQLASFTGFFFTNRIKFYYFVCLTALDVHCCTACRTGSMDGGVPTAWIIHSLGVSLPRR